MKWRWRKARVMQSHQRCAARRSRGLALTTMTRWIGVSFPTCAVAERTHASWTPKGGLSRQPVGLEPQWAEVAKPRWKSWGRSNWLMMTKMVRIAWCWNYHCWNFTYQRLSLQLSTVTIIINIIISIIIIIIIMILLTIFMTSLIVSHPW